MPRRLIFDTEGNGLLPDVTKIHCIAAKDPDTKEKMDWRPHELSRALEVLESADMLYAHNGIDYDYRALAKVHGFKVPPKKQGDTMVIARVIKPNIKGTDAKVRRIDGKPMGELHGKHSLEAWGQRLKRPKGDYDGPWDVWSEVMHSYMIDDVEVADALWDYLKPDDYSQEAIELEHRVQRLCLMITEIGWPFDVEAAGKLHTQIVTEKDELAKGLIEEFGHWYVTKGRKAQDQPCPVTGKKDKCVEWFTPKRNDAKRGYQVDVPLTRLEKVIFNPGSRDHIARVLKGMGWKPTKFTDGGSPKLDEDVLEEISGAYPQAVRLVRYLMLEKRLGQLAEGENAWLRLVGPDGRIHGRYNPMGTVTSRATHFSPNKSQVPARGKPYGEECRACFTVPKGWVMVGADLEGAQLRGFAHYLAKYDGGAYGKLVTSGDPHWANAVALGLAEGERDKASKLHTILRENGAKRFIYAFLFGCQGAMAGSIIRDACVIAKREGWPSVYDKFFLGGQGIRTVGDRALYSFYLKTPGLQKLNRSLQFILDDPRAASHMPALDGRWVPCRADHTALACLLQSAEAIICKRWICDAYDALVARGLRWGVDFFFLGWIHDELQTAVRLGGPLTPEEVGDIITGCARRAGDPYGFRIPLDSKYKIGATWADTH